MALKLHEQTTGRAMYQNVSIGKIRAAKGKELLELRTLGDTVYLELLGEHGAIVPNGTREWHGRSQQVWWVSQK